MTANYDESIQDWDEEVQGWQLIWYLLIDIALNADKLPKEEVIRQSQAWRSFLKLSFNC